MHISTIRTGKIGVQQHSLQELLDTHISELHENSIVVITSKIVALCEGSTAELSEHTKEELIQQESQLYLPAELSRYGNHFTITGDTLILMAGVDESNADSHYVLWPKDSQETANSVRAYLQKRFNVQNVGVLITDSACRPLRRGAGGIDLAHSGFKALKDYKGSTDLFGRPYKVTESSISGGLAAAAVVARGEGNEQTPVCILSELDFVEFQDRNPNQEELDYLHLSVEDDLFAPFLQAVEWLEGHNRRKDK